MTDTPMAASSLSAICGSFSTLLCHILGSHSEISGYVETHQSYVGTVQLDRLATIVRMATGDRVVRKYILDKILHNQVYIAPSVLSQRI